MISQVRVLRQAVPCLLQVATNLTSVHAEPSWLAEMLSQCTFGTTLEILEEQGRWVLVRQADGYLGWMYRPYLTDHPTPAPTYIVASPFTEIHAEPDAKSALRTRLVGRYAGAGCFHPRRVGGDRRQLLGLGAADRPAPAGPSAHLAGDAPQGHGQRFGH